MSNVRSQVQPLAQSVSILTGREIVAWVAQEMAATETPLVWQHPEVPFLQVTDMDVYLSDGSRVRLLSQFDDGTGYRGLYAFAGFEGPRLDPLTKYEVHSMFRTRELVELPLGVAQVAVVGRDGPNAEVEASITIGSHVVRLLAGEVYEGPGREVRVVSPDESILLQVDGLRPNPSIERTSQRPLRALWSTAHVER